MKKHFLFAMAARKRHRTTLGEVTSFLKRNWKINRLNLSLASVGPPQSKHSSKKLSKREIAKKVASYFDPLSLLAPILLQGKLTIQSLWAKGAEWDQSLDQTLADKFYLWENQLQKIDDLKINRAYASSKNNQQATTYMFSQMLLN